MVGRFIHGKGCINMKLETKELLIAIMGDNDHHLWLEGHNLHFGMSPQKMIDLGKEDEVIKYLEWAAYGPW
jgi:hypothetical protein